MSKKPPVKKLILIERFANLLMDEFYRLCGYDGYAEVNLLTIGDVVEAVRSRMAEKVWEEDIK